MNVAIIGTGYVGLPTGVCLAEIGHSVICIDIDENKIAALKQGKITLFEERLEDLFNKNSKSDGIKFTASMKEGVENADIVIIAVGTPPHKDTKEAELKYIFAAVEELASYLNKYTLIAVKSTVPVGTGDEIEKLIKEKNPKADFDIVSLPEFLREGFAIYDFFHPDRIIVGANTQKAISVIKEFYKYFQDKTEFLFVQRRSSETIKYASNSFLAVKIHYINEIANFCEKLGADIGEVAKGMSLDSRIGSKFLNPGPGYGGSCFPKDTCAISYMAKKQGFNLTLIDAAIEGNNERKKDMAKRIAQSVKDIKDARIAIWGLAFKDGTDDCRESPAIDIINELLKLQFSNIIVYDPKAISNAKTIFKNQVLYAKDEYECVKDADILAVLTEWNDFKKIDLSKIKTLMRSNKIFDLRNILDANQADNLGFDYSRIGR